MLFWFCNKLRTLEPKWPKCWCQMSPETPEASKPCKCGERRPRGKGQTLDHDAVSYNRHMMIELWKGKSKKWVLMKASALSMDCFYGKRSIQIFSIKGVTPMSFPPFYRRGGFLFVLLDHCYELVKEDSPDRVGLFFSVLASEQIAF